MSDDPNKIGKQWSGQQFAPVKTPDDVKQDQALQASYASADAISLDTYLAIKGVRDPVRVASMRGHTRVRSASMAAWLEIFKTY